MHRPAAAALLYAPDGYDTSRPRLMGRHAAGAGMLGAMVRHADFDRLVALTLGKGDAEAFRAQIAELGATVPAETLGDADFARLAETGCLMLPGPDLSGFAWRRRRASQASAFSLFGVTHTIASAGAMDSIADLLVAPVQPWDALVCTSGAVRGAVRLLWQSEGEWLARRTGATRIEGPVLPVIPLGVDTAALAPDPAARAAWRARLGIAPRDIAILHHGRLSFHAKAHPLPMFLGIARAAAAGVRGGGRVVLILSGWFADETQRRGFIDMARALAPGLLIRLVERPETNTTLRAAADIFTLLSDNIQESFGLAPIEAMAAGLPVVASDWDGLRDTVQHGVTGFRIPTLMAAPMADLAARHDSGEDSYDRYIAGVAQATAVDVGAAEAAFAALIQDPALRASMAAAARQQAVTRFDWAVVIGQYRALWADLAALRAAGSGERAAPRPGDEPRPRRPDPARLFADYPTRHLTAVTRLRLAPDLADATAARDRAVAIAALPGGAPRGDLLPGAGSLRHVGATGIGARLGRQLGRRPACVANPAHAPRLGMAGEDRRAATGGGCGVTIEAIIFDCDGTLVDSEGLGAEVLAAALNGEGFSISAAEVLLEFRGLRLATSLAGIEARCGRKLSADFIPRLHASTAVALRAGLREMPGASALLRSLRLPFCVASNAMRAKTELSLTVTGLLPLFAGRIFSAYEFGAWKPDPALFLHAAATLGVAPARCLVVEDSEAGVLAARAAGMPVLALLHEAPASWLPDGVPAIAGLDEVPAHL